MSRCTSTSTTSSSPATTRSTAATLFSATRPRAWRLPKLARARVDVGAILDFASSFGTVVLTRAYADWSADVNAEYREQLVGRAVDLVQLFPAAAYGKNAADIRLAVDAVEDMFRLPDLTHVVIVAGDSDYIPLAQRCKRLGRYVVGIGVAGSSSRSLAAACDDFVIYDSLPGVPVFEPPAAGEPAKRTKSTKSAERRAARPADRSHRAVEAGSADRLGEGRRRLAAQFGGQGTDEAHGPVVLGEVVGLQVVQRLPAVAHRCRRARRKLHDPDGQAALGSGVDLHRAVVIGQRFVRRPQVSQNRLAGKAFGKDPQPVAGLAVRAAGEAAAKRVAGIGYRGPRVHGTWPAITPQAYPPLALPGGPLNRAANITGGSVMAGPLSPAPAATPARRLRPRPVPADLRTRRRVPRPRPGKTPAAHRPR